MLGFVLPALCNPFRFYTWPPFVCKVYFRNLHIKTVVVVHIDPPVLNIAMFCFVQCCPPQLPVLNKKNSFHSYLYHNIYDQM